MDGPRITPDDKQPAPKVDPTRWTADQLATALKTFVGVPLKREIDMSPNRGTGWMGRR